MQRHLGSVSLVVVGLLLLAACQSSQADDSLINQEPCALPCWQGLTPGLTDQSAALQFLATSTLVDGNFGRYQQDAAGASQTWGWKNGKLGNTFEFDDQLLLTQIRLELTNQLTLSDLLKTYGAPTYVVGSIVLPGDGLSFVPSDGVNTTFFYYKQRLAVNWFSQMSVANNPVRYCPDLDAKIEEAYLYDQALADRYSEEYEPRTMALTLIVPGEQVVTVTALEEVQISCMDIPN